MDGAQRNFSMMAEKIDKMRCLRERCDNYVRLIKLTLDESIREQNSLLDGSAIYNRLKYLGLADQCSTPSSSAARKVDRPPRRYPTDLADFADDCKTFDWHDTEPVSPSVWSDRHSNYGPLVRRFPAATVRDVDDEIGSRRCSRYYGETANYRPPQQYRVYYFPTSKPIVQYPRHAAGRFYRRKPVGQYAQEEVPHWHSPRRPQPVGVVEREPFRRADQLEYRPKRPSGDDGPYRADYHHYSDADSWHRSPFSSVTRPGSPVLHGLQRYDGTTRSAADPDCSLLEKKIRDYVQWSPHDERIERKYVAATRPYCSENVNTYRSDYGPSEPFERSPPPAALRSRTRDGRRETSGEIAVFKRNPTTGSPPGKKTSIDETPEPRKDYRASYRKKSETPTPRLTAKRISFDLSNEDAAEQPDRKNSAAPKYVDQNPVKIENKFQLRKDSKAKFDDGTRRTSVLSTNDDYPTCRQRFLSNDSNAGSRKSSISRPEKLASMGISFESDKYSNVKDGFDENDCDGRRVEGTRRVLKILDEKNKDILKTLPATKTMNRDLRRDSAVNSSRRETASESVEKSNFDFVNEPESASDPNDDATMKRRESYGNEAEWKNRDISNGRKNSCDKYGSNEESVRNITSSLQSAKMRIDDYDGRVAGADEPGGDVAESIGRNGAEFGTESDDLREPSSRVVSNDDEYHYQNRSDDEREARPEQSIVIEEISEPVERPREFVDDVVERNAEVDSSVIEENRPDVEGFDYYPQEYSNAADVAGESGPAESLHDDAAAAEYYYRDGAPRAEDVVSGENPVYVPENYSDYYQQNDYADAELKANRYADGPADRPSNDYAMDDHYAEEPDRPRDEYATENRYAEEPDRPRDEYSVDNRYVEELANRPLDEYATDNRYAEEPDRSRDEYATDNRYAEEPDLPRDEYAMDNRYVEEPDQPRDDYAVDNQYTEEPADRPLNEYAADNRYAGEPDRSRDEYATDNRYAEELDRPRDEYAVDNRYVEEADQPRAEYAVDDRYAEEPNLPLDDYTVDNRYAGEPDRSRDEYVVDNRYTGELADQPVDEYAADNRYAEEPVDRPRDEYAADNRYADVAERNDYYDYHGEGARVTAEEAVVVSGDDYYGGTAVDEGGYYGEPVDEGRVEPVMPEVAHYDGYDDGGYRPADSRPAADDHYDGGGDYNDGRSEYVEPNAQQNPDDDDKGEY